MMEFFFHFTWNTLLALEIRKFLYFSSFLSIILRSKEEVENETTMTSWSTLHKLSTVIFWINLKASLN